MRFDDRPPSLGRVVPRPSTLYEWSMGMGLRLVIRCVDGEAWTARIETEENRSAKALDPAESSWRG